MTDTAIAYGARCTWWDSADKAALSPGGKPSCPLCGGLARTLSAEEFYSHLDGLSVHTPGFREAVTWGRGRCFMDFHEARAAFEQEREPVAIRLDGFVFSTRLFPVSQEWKDKGPFAFRDALRERVRDIVPYDLEVVICNMVVGSEVIAGAISPVESTAMPSSADIARANREFGEILQRVLDAAHELNGTESVPISSSPDVAVVINPIKEGA